TRDRRLRLGLTRPATGAGGDNAPVNRALSRPGALPATVAGNAPLLQPPRLTGAFQATIAGNAPPPSKHALSGALPTPTQPAARRRGGARTPNPGPVARNRNVRPPRHPNLPSAPHPSDPVLLAP